MPNTNDSSAPRGKRRGQKKCRPRYSGSRKAEKLFRQIAFLRHKLACHTNRCPKRCGNHDEGNPRQVIGMIELQNDLAGLSFPLMNDLRHGYKDRGEFAKSVPPRTLSRAAILANRQ